MKPKVPTDSRVTLSHLMGPQDANLHGNVHGGVIMKMVDEAGALAAMRHSESLVVTVQLDRMTFRRPILVGHLVTMTAEVTFVGRTSMETRVEVKAENPLTGECTETNLAYLVYVAIDSNGDPTSVPPLEAQTEAHQLRMEQAQKRQAFRKEQLEAELEINRISQANP